MDIRMPIMDGYAATATIRSEMRKTDSGVDTKIIAITASAFEEDRLKVIEHGGNDFVRKPFRESDIFEIINKHLGVTYVFEQEEDVIPPSRPGYHRDDILTAAFKVLPEELLSRLKEATELSDAGLIDQVISEISTKDAQLAGVLLKLAGNFAYDKILALMPAAQVVKQER
jgi:CheY-like chemotaxis protein